MVTDIARMRKKQLLAVIEQEEIDVDNPAGLGVKELRQAVKVHFDTPPVITAKVSKEAKVEVKAYDKPFATLTDKQLLNVTKRFGWTDAIKGGKQGWQLKALTIGHTVPSTHAEALATSKRLAGLLNDKLEHTATPRLHYAKSKGTGVDSRFATSYHPGKFGSRSKLGDNHALKCLEHGIQYDLCSGGVGGCRVAIEIDGAWAFETVKRKRVAKRRKNKADKSANSDTVGTLIDELEGAAVGATA